MRRIVRRALTWVLKGLLTAAVLIVFLMEKLEQ